MKPELMVMRLSGKLDTDSTAKFKREVAKIAESQPKFLLLNFQDVHFMDSAGLGGLISALKTIRLAGGDLAVCSLNEQVQMLFDLTNMSTVIKTYTNPEDFAIKSSNLDLRAVPLEF